MSEQKAEGAPQQTAPKTGSNFGINSVLKDTELIPEMMRNTLRAGLFPETRDRVMNSIRQDLVSQSLAQILLVESRHKRSCWDIKLDRIEPLQKRRMLL